MRTLPILAVLVVACSSPTVPGSAGDALDSGVDAAVAEAGDSAGRAPGPDAADAAVVDSCAGCLDPDAFARAPVDALPGDVSATAACGLPVAFTDTQRVVKLAITEEKVTVDGKEYLDGCDLDGDGIPNNVLGKVGLLYKDMNKTLNEKLVDGTLALAITAISQPQALEFLAVQPVVPPACDAKVKSCPILVNRGNYHAGPGPQACAAKWRMVPGMIPGTWVLAPGATASLAIPVVGIELTMTASSARWLPSGDGSNGRLCGTMEQLGTWLCPDGSPVPWYQCTPDCAKYGCVQTNSILKPDIDTNGDGVKDSLSFSFDLGLAPAGDVSLAPAP